MPARRSRVGVSLLAWGLVASAVVATSVVVARPVAGSLVAPHDALVIDGERSDFLTQGQHIWLASLTASPTTTSSVDITATDGARTYQVQFSAPSGQPLAVGVYEGATRFGFATTTPGLGVTGESRTCNTVTGRFIVDELTRDGSDTLLSYSARFEIHCDGGIVAAFGAVSYHATADFRDRTFDRDLVDFGNEVYAGQISEPQRVTVTNHGPSTLTVTGAVFAEPQAGEFEVSGTCVGATLAVGQSCGIDVRLAPTSPGLKLVRLAIFDDFAPAGGGGTGRDLVFTGNALSGPAPWKAHGEFTPLSPARVFDTRTGIGRSGAIGDGETLDVQITGRGGVPASNVLAVVVNVTVAEPTAPSYLTVWPAGVPRPNISNLNYVSGQTVPNLVTVALGAGGRLSVFNERGSAHLLFDVVGFYATDDGVRGGRFHATEPARLVDSRDGTGAPGPIGPGATLAVRTAPVGDVPGGAIAIALNVTVTQPTATGYLTVAPADTAVPNASSLNFVAGQTVSNLVVVRLPATGVVQLFNEVGTTHVVIDVVGFYDLDYSTARGRLMTGTPVRLFDSRVRSPYPGSGAIPEDSVLVQPRLSFDASAYLYNVTAVAPTRDGFVSVFPAADRLPNVSNLNFAAGQTVPNQVVVRPGDQGEVYFYNRVGDTHLLIDLFGYFTSATTPH
jgi:hypothetical protein